MAPPALAVVRLRKTYRSGFTALHDLDLEIPDGAFFGLLGPNGAGKSTLIAATCNLLRPSAGQIRIFGHDNDSRTGRALVGLAEQEVNLDRFLTNVEILIYHAGYYGVGRREATRRAHDLLELLGLADKAKLHPHALSGGMQRRLLVARALIHRPRLLILDEPTAGVDVELRADLWGYMRDLHRIGHTILLTTHYLEEAEVLCDEVALIKGGRIISRDSAARLRAEFGAAHLAEVYERVIAAPAVGFVDD
ncbi:MAG: ABC transporter ATP-binding protein [Mycobacterium sp.]